jgi:hypothetical protein
MEDFMTKTILAVLLLASAAYPRDDAAKARMAAGCGPSEINFEVKTDKKQHPTGQPEQGRALVYVFANTDADNGVLSPPRITRFGLDGAWVGATNLRSYFFFSTDPGEHHLCSNGQSIFKSRTDQSAALTFTAEPGKVYYFATRTEHHSQPPELPKLVLLDSAEAQLLIASSAHSTFQQKK